VSITAAGREVVDQVTARRRELLAEILGGLSPRRQAAIAAALQSFAAAAGEVPDSLWPQPATAPGGAGIRAAAGRGGARRATRKGTADAAAAGPA
jgi:hypothetical protein